jgi:hypothetical protein
MGLNELVCKDGKWKELVLKDSIFARKFGFYFQIISCYRRAETFTFYNSLLILPFAPLENTQ